MGEPLAGATAVPELVYERIGKLEQVSYAHEFRLRSIENERIPHRLSVMETTLPQMRDEMSRVETTCNEINSKLSTVITNLEEKVASTQTIQKAYVIAIGVILTLINLFPQLKELLK